MNMQQLVEALAVEIETIKKPLDQHLDALLIYPLDAGEFMDALDLYSSQVQRMGEAAELAGFVGLKTVADHVLENTLMLAATEDRQEIIDFLRLWPDLVVHYLRNTDDSSTAAGLVDVLKIAPLPLEEEAALKLMHRLSQMPQQQGQPSSERPPVLATPADVSLDMPSDVDAKLLEGFLQEAPEQAATLVALVGKLSNNSAEDGDLTAAKRACHTLKGTGALIGIRALATLGHYFEDVLEYFEQQHSEINPGVATVLLDSAYCIEQIVAFIAGTDAAPENILHILQNVLDLANRIDRGDDLSDAQFRYAQNAGAPVAAANKVAAAPVHAAALRINLDKIEELFRVSAEVSVHSAAMEAKLKTLSQEAHSLLSQNLRVKKRLYELETLVDVRSLNLLRATGSYGAQAGEVDSLELDQYNELHSTTHALVEEANDAIAFSHALENGIAGFSALQSQQQVLARDLQHLVINTRMAEVGNLESRMARNIRTACQATGKQAQLKFIGGNTLIDSDVLSRLAEPLLHILRNAIDHGIEMPAARQEAGKDVIGSIELDFSRQGQQVVLRCSDDGRGLDIEKIRARAIERGLIGADQVLNDTEIARLIFRSGFSTRESVTELSGRGVGLDVVREWATSMNGSASISNRPEGGTLLEMRFAASLSTIQSLIVDVGGHYFALPSMQIEQALSHDAGKFNEDASGGWRYAHGRRLLPAHKLSQLLGLSASLPLAEQQVVIMRVRDELIAFAVDKLIDSRELLLKSPDRFSGKLLGVTGSSILGDGRVAVHIDIAQLMGAGSQVTADAAVADVPMMRSKPVVLVVDDSLSVRTTLKELVGDAGYDVVTARDGVDALEQIQKNPPAAVLTDLEMPNMNGIELCRHIRQDDHLRHLPVVMITSRSQDKHRQMAQQVGIDVYLTKPYNDADVLKAISKGIGGH